MDSLRNADGDWDFWKEGRADDADASYVYLGWMLDLLQRPYLPPQDISTFPSLGAAASMFSFALPSGSALVAHQFGALVDRHDRLEGERPPQGSDAAALLAAAIGQVYILGRVLRVRKNDDEVYAGIYRMTYGVMAFGLLFSVVGTVLGGIWANESWGRFWGWDPKENGALMIVLWMLILFHARRGGYIQGLGFNMGAVVCGMVVAFSWWGVNLLGVGLHSYGFTSGIFRVLVGFYVLETLVVLLGCFV